MYNSKPTSFSANRSKLIIMLHILYYCYYIIKQHSYVNKQSLGRNVMLAAHYSMKATTTQQQVLSFHRRTNWLIWKHIRNAMLSHWHSTGYEFHECTCYCECEGFKMEHKKRRRLGAKTIKKNTNSTQNKSQTHRAKQYEVTSFLSTDCELSTETCSKSVYSLGPWCARNWWCYENVQAEVAWSPKDM